MWRVWTSRLGRQRLLGRSLDYASFYLAAGWRLWRLTSPGNIVIAKTDPPLLSVIAACIARLRGARLINWQQDIFPEVAGALGIGGRLGHLAFALLRRPRNWSLRAASFNVVLGNRMAETVRQLGIPAGRIRIIPNWSDGKGITPIDRCHNPLRVAWGLERQFVVGYAGNLGRAHEIETVLQAMKALYKRSIASPADETAKAIKFIFIGGGALRPRLEAEASVSELGNVQFHGYQPREQLAATLCAADLHLVILNPKLEGFIVPSKLYAIAAASRPVIFIGDRSGEVARLLNEVGCGFTVEPNDVTGLQNRILQFARSPVLCRMMGARARAAFELQWDKDIAVARWERLITGMNPTADSSC